MITIFRGLVFISIFMFSYSSSAQMFIGPLQLLSGILACSDNDLLKKFGVKAGSGRNDLGGFDSEFRGSRGQKFKELVERVAEEANSSPSCLAVSALAETGNNRPWVRRGPVDSAQLGLDFWHRQRKKVGKGIPNSILKDPNNPNCTFIGGVCRFDNEQDIDTGIIYRFPSAYHGLRAMAAWMNELDRKLSHHVGPSEWAKLPESVRCALVRFAYNPGKNPKPTQYERAKAAVEALNAGRSSLSAIPTNTPIKGSGSPARTSGVRAAQAVHLSNTVFGVPIGCP